MEEVEAYRLHESINGSANDAKDAAKLYAVKLTIYHLYHSHGVKVKELARSWGIKMKEVQAIVSGKLEDEEE